MWAFYHIAEANYCLALALIASDPSSIEGRSLLSEVVSLSERYGFQWYKKQALEGLANFGQPGSDQPVEIVC